jgi:hypothetical protein
MPKQLAPYGICHQCEAPIQIPGLEAFKCLNCNWIKRPSRVRSFDEKQPIVAFTPQPKQLELTGVEVKS